MLVSIPSRRVGDRSSPASTLPTRSRFHPLKAGRRLLATTPTRAKRQRFHPLKAGRRPAPRQVRWSATLEFPSPQGGSETPIWTVPSNMKCRFPSPQGGSETLLRSPPTSKHAAVSIPSRRVGDAARSSSLPPASASFHPLKAGRRRLTGVVLGDCPVLFPSPQGGSETPSQAFGQIVSAASFHPLKAGRRPHYTSDEAEKLERFHPLKAGRRRSLMSRSWGALRGFPSPQGGSETGSATLSD